MRFIFESSQLFVFFLPVATVNHGADNTVEVVQNSLGIVDQGFRDRRVIMLSPEPMINLIGIACVAPSMSQIKNITG